MTTTLHSQVVEGSRHAIHNLTYPDAANRIAGTGEGSSINPPTSANLWQIAKQNDDNSLWMLVDDAPLTWVQIPTSTTGDLDFSYDAFGGAGTVTIDAGTLTWAPTGAYDFLVDIENANTTKGFKVEIPDVGHYFLLRNVISGTNRLWMNFNGNNFDVTTTGPSAFHCADDFLAETDTSFYLWGHANSEVQAIGAAANLLFGARNSGIYLNESGHESLVAAYASVNSIIGALNLVAGGTVGGNLDVGYNLFGASPSTVVVDAAEGQGTTLKFDLDSAVADRFFEISLVNGMDITGGDGTVYHTGFKVENGADGFRVYRNATDKIDILGNLDTIALASAVKTELSTIERNEYLSANTTGATFFLVGSSSVPSSIALNAASGVQTFAKIDAQINQSGTAGYNALLVDVDVNAEGSGVKNIISAQYGGASRFRVDKTGAIYGKSSTSDGSTDLINLADSLTAVQFRVDSDGHTRIGTGTPGIATGAGDLYVSADIEGAGDLYLTDNKVVKFGASQDASLGYDNNQIPADALILGVSTDSDAFIICQDADRTYNFGHASAGDPTVFIHSRNQSTTEFLGLYHDRTHGRIKTGAGAVCIGTGTPGYATGVGDLYVTGKGEFDDSIQLADGRSYFVGGQDSTIGHSSGTTEGAFRFRASSQSPDSNLMMTGSRSNAWVFCEYADAAFDFAHALQTNPTLFIQSANQSTTEWLSFAHDQTYGRIKTGAGAVCIGTGTPGVATGTGDLYVTSDIECDAALDVGTGITVRTGFVYGAAVNFTVGNSSPAAHGALRWQSSDQTVNTALICTGTTSNAYVLCEYNDRTYDFAHALQTNPTLFGHSANQSTTEWWSLTHNQTDGVLATGAGALSLAPASGVIKYPDAGQTLYDIAPASNLTATGDTHSATVFANATGIGAALYQKSDSQWAEADADALATMPCRALALETGTGTKKLLRRGWIRNDSWSWTPGAPVYVSTTTGGLTQTKPSGTGDQVQIVGYAETADILDFNPSSVIVEVA